MEKLEGRLQSTGEAKYVDDIPRGEDGHHHHDGSDVAGHLGLLREALTEKKMFFLGHCPKGGGGDPCPNFFTLFPTMFSLIF